jgi:hypothetical protein
MAWTGLPATQSTDWSSISFCSQFWAAVRERKMAIGESTADWDLPAAGADVQDMGTAEPTGVTDEFSVWVLQDWIETNCTAFVATLDASSNPITTATYDGGTADPEMWTWQRAVDRVLGGNGWTRRTEIGTSWGKVTAGDYFASHLWNELSSVLNELVWTLLWTGDEWDADGETNHAGVTEGLLYAFGTGANWAAAKTSSESEYANQASEDRVPRAYSRGDELAGGTYNARLDRRYSYNVASNLSTDFAKAIDFFIWPRDFPRGWHAHGESWTSGQWAFHAASTGAAADSAVLSSVIGDTALTQPTWCSEPTYPNGEGHGWQVGREGGPPQSSAAFAIVRWNVTNGFTYQS